MSEYFLADRKAEERDRQKEPQQQQKAGEMKVTLLGDFLYQTQESAGADPYNSTQGKAVREAWKTRRDRR
jgi:hypothetical protein